MPTILIDTNLLVYLYDNNAPDKQEQARQVLDRLDWRKTGCLSVQNLAEFLRVSTQKLKPPLTASQALEQVNLFIRMWPVFDLTPLVVLEAARGARDYSLSYFDAQIWASARLNQVPVIFSEDFSPGQTLEGVRFVNPFAPDFRLQDWS
ncbi:MAG: PIN domain-containing protein [Anaerolineales bacterium]|nr:PIN domain-containing protein [Anaerolineales bacterium]